MRQPSSASNIFERTVGPATTVTTGRPVQYSIFFMVEKRRFGTSQDYIAQRAYVSERAERLTSLAYVSVSRVPY
ncbi:hypothetical protein EVAR_764_1 [Eumeta japonica]|uniref:Uncharacterized protein n=1 Tax=Eumeta variegata TaxID=151549 RepID=A0A4C1SCS4_EUMVA|nr:hypothetical protein EVAR_764_1 [Eumeta japonica]